MQDFILFLIFLLAVLSGFLLMAALDRFLSAQTGERPETPAYPLRRVYAGRRKRRTPARGAGVHFGH